MCAAWCIVHATSEARLLADVEEFNDIKMADGELEEEEEEAAIHAGRHCSALCRRRSAMRAQPDWC